VVIGFLPAGTKDWRPARCADGWVIVTHNHTPTGFQMTVARYRDTPWEPKAVGTWNSTSGRNAILTGMTRNGVPQPIAEVLYGAVENAAAPGSGAAPPTCPTLTDLQARTDLDRPTAVSRCKIGTTMVAVFGEGGTAQQPILLMRPRAGGPWKVIADGAYRVDVCALARKQDTSFGPDCGAALPSVEPGKPIG